ncbi:MAG TPA: nitroreductase family deazaflavin-dependent oxidoreductase [Candidatus Limnocylindrales bacterium]
MRRTALLIGGLSGGVVGGVAYWRRHPRTGSGFVNRVVNPVLVERGIAGASRAEIGTLEHVGRRSGQRRRTPVHPVPTADGFRIVVPLGAESQWARNVLAAGHCRLQYQGVVHELDEPLLVAPTRVPGIAAPLAALQGWLGFRYLRLRRFAERPGTLDDVASATDATAASGPADAASAGAGIPSAEEAGSA